MRKFGLIVRIPNCILDNPLTDPLEMIKEHMGIDVNECRVCMEEVFESDITLVRLTSTRPMEGLIEHSYFSEIVQKIFPVEEVIGEM